MSNALRKRLNKKLNNARSIITDDDKRKYIQYKWICLILGAVAAMMTIVNVISYIASGYSNEIFRLSLFTATFSISCFINILVLYRAKKYANLIVEIIFSVEVIILFTYFIISGGTEGFSIVWIMIIPTAGMILFGLKDGTIIASAILFIMALDFIVISLVDVSDINLFYNWSTTQKIRYPLVYIASYAISVFFEYLRVFTHRELVNLKYKYEELYKKDALTGLFNRHGFNDAIEKLVHDGKKNVIGFQIFDIDFFKSVNDTYGHINGDIALKTVADTFQNNLDVNATIYRWGGEEFAVLYYDAASALKTAKKVHNSIMQGTVDFDDKHIKITGSSGLIICETTDNIVDFSKLINDADELLYEAKRSGRNRVVFKNTVDGYEGVVIFGDPVKN